MATLAVLRKQAKAKGIPASEIKAATTASALAEVIKTFGKPAKKSGAVKKSAAVKKSSGRKSAPAKSKRTTGTAKRPTAAKSNGYVAKGGRNVLDSVDYNETDGWNARPGSAPDRIVKALKKFRGNRDKVFDFLADDIWDFVGKKMRDGSKRTKADAEKMLRYRIARTEWDFAMRTGQHSKATNRVEYGTGGTGEGTFKRAKSAKSKTATKTKTAPAKRGRPPKAASAASKTKTRGAKSKTRGAKSKSKSRR